MTGPRLIQSSLSIHTDTTHQSTFQDQQHRWGWIFISPWIAGFIIFYLFPMLASLIFSFTNFKMGQELQWVGLRNWNKLFTDPGTLNSFVITIQFAGLMLPVTLLFPILTAALLTSNLLAGKFILRTLFYTPYVVPIISTIFVWMNFLNGQSGWLNKILLWMGARSVPNWLDNTTVIYPALVLIGLWGTGNAMLTFMVSMQSVPTELYDAARVDGGAGVQIIRHITIPHISPIIFYNLVLSVIGLMQYFAVPFVIANSGGKISNTLLNFVNVNLYYTAFRFNDMGFAAAQGWFLFAITFILTVILFRSSRRWVYYTS